MSWSLSGGLLSIWSTTAFWILGKILHLRSMNSKLMRCIENCNVCSQQCSTERAQFFSMTTTDHTSHNQCFKSRTILATNFCLICHIHLTSHHTATTSSSTSAIFAEMLPQQHDTDSFQEFTEFQCMGFYATGIYKHFSLAKKCWL